MRNLENGNGYICTHGQILEKKYGNGVDFVDKKYFDDLQSRIEVLEKKTLVSGGLNAQEFCELVGLLEIMELLMEDAIERYGKKANSQAVVEVGRDLLEKLKDGRKIMVQERNS